MFSLSDGQMRVLAARTARGFEERMLVHLGRYFPRRVAALGDAGARALIRTGIARAAGHGFVDERDVCRFVDLMVAIGPEFDREAPWAVRLLADRTGDPGIRAVRLHEAGLAHLRRADAA